MLATAIKSLGFMILVASSVFSHTAFADYPDKPIRIVVPYNPGGAGDVMARLIAKSIGVSLGTPVIVENQPGASGMIGTTSVTRAKGNPYTLLLGSSAEISINPFLYRSIAYKPESDLQPVAFAGKLPLVLVASPSLAARNLKDVLDLSKANPNSIAFVSAGAGQTAHLAMEVIMRTTKTSLLHVPYKGGSEAVMAVVSNQAQLFFSGLPPALPQIQAGKLRPLAVSTKDRIATLPNVPTVQESGVANFDIYNWFAVFAPADVPADIISKLHKTIDAAAQSDELKKAWEKQGIGYQPMTLPELQRFVASETEKYKTLVKTAQIKLD